MAVVTFRIPDDLAERLTAHARRLGGRSAVLRQLVEDATLPPAVPAPADGVVQPPPTDEGRRYAFVKGRDAPPSATALPAITAALGPSMKVTVRLAEAEVARVIEVAQRRGMNRTQWIAALVRARLRLDLPQTGDERAALRAIARELNRIGGNINQIARAANADVARSGGVVPIDPAAIVEAREAIQTATAELRFVLARSAGYWDVDP